MTPRTRSPPWAPSACCARTAAAAHGVAVWTARIEAGWRARSAAARWYPGRPLLVTKNDYGLRLYNGDAGVVVATGPASVAAAFERRGEPSPFAPSRLTAIETVYAMTVHKSQGSQFGTAAVLLPPPTSQILTRELLYTAVTRAARAPDPRGTEETIRAAIARPVARASGLAPAACDRAGWTSTSRAGRPSSAARRQGIGRAIAAGLAAQRGGRVDQRARRASASQAAVELRRRRASPPTWRPPTAPRRSSRRSPTSTSSSTTSGSSAPTPVLEIDDDTWQRYWDVNVMSAIRLTRGYLPGMRERGWGRVQFMASDSAVVIPLEMVHYGVTKTALLGVSRGFAKAMKGTGVTVNSVIAGPTHTEGVEDFVRELVGDDKAWDEAQRAVRRRAPPELAARPPDRAGRDREPRRLPELGSRVGHDRRRDPRRRRLRRPHPAVIAVTGATGEVGRRVVAQLDAPLLVVRDASRAPDGCDVRVASDYGAFDEMRAALEGARRCS